MVRTSLIFTVVLAGTIAVGMAASQGLRAQERQEQVPKEKITPLLKTTLAGMEGKEVNIVHISAPPGFATPKHFHPGHVFVYVLEGAVTLEMEGDAPLKLGPGDIFHESPGRAMVGKNLSSTHGAELVVFQIGDEGKPLTVEAE
ncbi:MAG: cupin domain-containing protein [Kiloniellaceae bacterium]